MSVPVSPMEKRPAADGANLVEHRHLVVVRLPRTPGRSTSVLLSTMEIGPWRNSKKWNGSETVWLISLSLRLASQASP